MSSPDLEPLPAPRTTRSKKVFSPWEIYEVKHPFDIARKAQEIHDSMLANASSLLPAEGSDALSDLSDLSDLSPPPSPINASMTSPLTSPPTTPVPLPNPMAGPSKDLNPKNDLERRKARRKATRTLSRNRKRQEAAASFTVNRVRETIMERYVNKTQTRKCDVDLEKDAKGSARGYIGRRGPPFSSEVHRLEDLVGPSSPENFDLLDWNGTYMSQANPLHFLANSISRDCIALVDCHKRLIGVLAGNAGGADWPQMLEEAADEVEYWHSRCSFPDRDKKGKRSRGDFDTLACGVSYGGGQTKPTNIHNTWRNQDILNHLNGLRCFKRISGFSTSVVATRAPDLYQYYITTMKALYSSDPTLIRPFPGSIFAGTTYNMGPRTCCCKHTDKGNLLCGVCSITPVGRFNPKRGGHLVLWDLHLIIEFPPGSTILIPSAILSHSNTAILPTERRYSFTQYTAGGLFRWVENGFMTTERRVQSLTPEELELDRERDSNRWHAGVALLPVVDHLPELPPPN